MMMMMLMIENSSSTHSNSKHRQQGMKPVRKDGDDAVHHREEMKVATVCFDGRQSALMVVTIEKGQGRDEEAKRNEEER